MRTWKWPVGFYEEMSDEPSVFWSLGCFLLPACFGIFSVIALGLPLTAAFGLMNDPGCPWTIFAGVGIGLALYFYSFLVLSRISYYRGLLENRDAEKAMDKYRSLPRKTRKGIGSPRAFSDALRIASPRETRKIDDKMRDYCRNYTELQKARDFKPADRSGINNILANIDDKNEVAATLLKEYRKVNADIQKMLD